MEPDDELDSLQATDPVESRELWDKRPDETAKAFGAFVLYRDAERRSFKIVGDQLNCSPQNIYQWSSRFDWRGRYDAFDIEHNRQGLKKHRRRNVKSRAKPPYVFLREIAFSVRSEEHTSELQSLRHLVCRLLLE